MNCKKPDRNIPELICGHPLPCPWHTVTVDTTKEPPIIQIPTTVDRPINKDQLEKLKEIANIIAEKDEK